MMPRLVVPAYFHPDWAEDDWRWLVESGQPQAVILNPASGPGEVPDPSYRYWTERLLLGGTEVLGYVPISYGSRSSESIGRDIERYLAWYRLSGVFLDQSPTGHDAYGLAAVRACCLTARRLLGESGLIALNPGVTPASELFALADRIVTAECTWADYLASSPLGGANTWHLVHSGPSCAAALNTAVGHAARHGSSACYVTSLRMPNPWERLDPLLTGSASATGKAQP